jgi:ATP-dependent exoDNAse (exonuclease V) alpha subunit
LPETLSPAKLSESLSEKSKNENEPIVNLSKLPEIVEDPEVKKAREEKEAKEAAERIRQEEIAQKKKLYNLKLSKEVRELKENLLSQIDDLIDRQNRCEPLNKIESF